MSWGAELWDQYDNLSAHITKGIQDLDKFGNFVRERIQIESEYAAKLKKLTKSYQPKKSVNEIAEPTALEAYNQMLTQVDEIVGQREIFVESLKSKILQNYCEFTQKLQHEKKSCAHDYALLTENLSTRLSSLERAKRHYEKTFHESKKATENYKRADLDLNLSRVEVYRCNNLMHTKQQEAAEAHLEYTKHLQRANIHQEQHYGQLLPAVINRLQFVDVRRASGIGEFIASLAEIELASLPLLFTCLNTIKRAGRSVDAAHEAQIVLRKFKTGQMPPGDIPYEDLAKQQKDECPLSVKSAKCASSFMKDVALFKVYKNLKERKLSEVYISLKNLLSLSSTEEKEPSALTSNQRKKLHIKIGEVYEKLKKEEDAYKDLMKLKIAFDNEAASGDPDRVTEQLNKIAKKIDKLKSKLKKYQNILEAPPKEVTTEIVDNDLQYAQSLTETCSTESADDETENETRLHFKPSDENSVAKVQQWLENINEPSPRPSARTSRTSVFDSGKGSFMETSLELPAASDSQQSPKAVLSRIFKATCSNEAADPLCERQV